MTVPILKQGDILVACVQAALTDRDLIRLNDDLAGCVGRFRSRGVLVDISALDVIDSFAARTLRAIAHMTRLRGALTCVVGIAPDVACAMVELGLTLDDVDTALDLEDGLAQLSRRCGRNAAPYG